jgi:hypothetical protein
VLEPRGSSTIKERGQLLAGWDWRASWARIWPGSPTDHRMDSPALSRQIPRHPSAQEISYQACAAKPTGLARSPHWVLRLAAKSGPARQLRRIMTLRTGTSSPTTNAERTPPADPRTRQAGTKGGTVSHPSLGSPESGKDKSVGRRPSKTGNTVIGPLIGGIFTLAAGFVGGGFLGPRTNVFPQPQPTVTITATVPPPPASPPGTRAGSGTQSSPGKQLLQKNRVRLTQGNQLSLTDPALRPFSTSGSCTGDLYVCFGHEVGSTAQLAVYDGPAGFSQCHADTDYVSTFANVNNQPLVGQTLCVTSGHRIAACYVTNDTTQATGVPDPGLTMNITVYASK